MTIERNQHNEITHSGHGLPKRVLLAALATLALTSCAFSAQDEPGYETSPGSPYSAVGTVNNTNSEFCTTNNGYSITPEGFRSDATFRAYTNGPAGGPLIWRDLDSGTETRSKIGYTGTRVIGNLIVTGDPQNHKVIAIDGHTQEKRTLYKDYIEGSSLAESPNGQILAGEVKTEDKTEPIGVAIFTLDGKQSQLISKDIFGRKIDLLFTNPRWDLNGRKITFTAFDNYQFGGRASNIYSVNVSDDGFHLNQSPLAALRANIVPTRRSESWWTSSGEQIAFMQRDNPQISQWQTYVMNPDGSELKQVRQGC